MTLVIPSTDIARRVARYAGVGNVRIINAFKNNPYDGAPEVQRNYTPDEPIGTSSLGTPIYTDLTLLGCQYTDNITGKVVTLANDRFAKNQGSNTGATQQGGFYLNLETVLITVSQGIRIIKTEIQGRNGTVKEYIGADDARITINGIITGQNGVYPRDEVNRLKQWLDAPVSKGIVAWWLDNLGISNIVVEAYSIPQVEGGYSYQMFSIDCISDLPVTLKITQPNV